MNNDTFSGGAGAALKKCFPLTPRSLVLIIFKTFILPVNLFF